MIHLYSFVLDIITVERSCDSLIFSSGTRRRAAAHNKWVFYADFLASRVSAAAAGEARPGPGPEGNYRPQSIEVTLLPTTVTTDYLLL